MIIYLKHSLGVLFHDFEDLETSSSKSLHLQKLVEVGHLKHQLKHSRLLIIYPNGLLVVLNILSFHYLLSFISKESLVTHSLGSTAWDRGETHVIEAFQAPESCFHVVWATNEWLSLAVPGSHLNLVRDCHHQVEL